MSLKKIEIIYEDNDIIVVNKPANFLSTSDRFDKEKPNVVTHLRERYEEVFTVHRLDKETSGILCFARTSAAHKDLSQQFQDRKVKQLYWVIIQGILIPTEGSIDKAIAPHPVIQGKVIVTNKGKKSLTHYKVVEQFKNFCLVEADIKTGRTRQIRVHFESIGFPLAVDKIYGSYSAFNLSQIKFKGFNLGKDQEERPLMTRTSLHSYQLDIIHPSTKESTTFLAPPPKDFRAVLKQLQKWNK